MLNSYVVSLNDAINCLNGFVSDMHSEYKKKGVNVQLGYDEERGGAVTSSNPILPVKNVSISVGAKSMFDNAKNGYVRSQDLVYIVSTVFHEERHLQQRAILYQDKNASQDIVDMAKCDVISGTFPEYEKLIYFFKPSEVDAEEVAWKKCVQYFDTHFLDENNKPMIDSRKELVDQLWEFNCQHKQWYGMISSGSYESAIKSLEENREYYKYADVDIFTVWHKNSERYKQLVKANHGLYAHSYVNAKTPEEARQVLYEFAVDMGEFSTIAFPCLKKSVDDVKSGKRIVVPAMSRVERLKLNLSRAENLRFQDVYNHMSDVPSSRVQPSQRPSVKQQSSREASLNRLVRNIDYPDTQSDHDHEHNELS